jgi:hypothetical protein
MGVFLMRKFNETQNFIKKSKSVQKLFTSHSHRWMDRLTDIQHPSTPLHTCRQEFFSTFPLTIAQSFSPFLARDGQQVHCPRWIWATSLCYILLNKFVALVGSGRQTCRPSHDEKGLKDWANVCSLCLLSSLMG